MNKSIQFNRSKIVYSDEGKGKVLIMLHGFLESKEIWNTFTEQLRSAFRIIAIDLPGHGESEAVGEVHTVEMQAEVIHDILTVEKIDKALLVGHSMGGYIAAAFCEQYEHFCSGLVFFHSHAAPDTEEAKENRLRMSQIVRENKTAFILQFIPALFDPKHAGEYTDSIAALQQQAIRMDPKSIVASLMGMRERKGSLDYLSRAKIPVMFIVGKQDSLMPFMHLLSQSALASHSETLFLVGVAHMGYLEAPRKTAEAVKHFAIRCFEALEKD